MGDTAARIVTELREKFHRHDVWVWYDSQETYTGAIDDIRSGLAADDINVAVCEDSFLELKHRVWKEDPDLDEQWLFYVPTSKNDAKWFMDIHSLGKQYRTGADVDSNSPASQYLIEHESEIPDEFSTWGQNEATRRKAFFCVLFDTQEDNPAEWILRYLNDPDAYEETIQEYGQTDDWSALLDERYGISASLDPEDIATEILFGEVAVSSPTSRYDELAADERIESKRLCEYWQQHDPATYVEYARSVAAEYDLKTAVLDSGNVDWHSTAFRGIDEGLVRLCLDRLNDADYVDLPEIAADLHTVVGERRRGFWYEEGYAGYWDVLAPALSALDGIGDARTALDEQVFSPSELHDRYVADWWTVDRDYRQYIQATTEDAAPVPGLSTLKNRVTQQYMDFLKAVNRPLAEGLGDEPRLTTPQTQFFDEYAATNEKTAIFICDGLRYELAETLRDELSYDFDHQLEAVSAALPSVTEVGMAAHLPGQLGLAVEDDELQISVDGEPTENKQSRVERFTRAGFEVADLTDIFDTPLEDLQTAESVPRILYSGIIDKLGENIDDDEALARAEGHVTQVQKAIQRLRYAGYERFIITADHGFLFTDRLSNDLKLDAPDLAPIVKRRFAAANADAPLVGDAEYITLESVALESLGIDAPDVQFLFPRSVACFRARGGNMRYFHGGISIQELLVPCLTVTTEELDESASISYSVSIPDPITNTIVAVNVEAKSEQVSFDRTPTLEIRASIDDEPVSDPVDLDISPGSNSASVRLKQGAIAGESSVTLELVDTDTRETIERRRVALDLLFGDDDMGFDV